MHFLTLNYSKVENNEMKFRFWFSACAIHVPPPTCYLKDKCGHDLQNTVFLILKEFLAKCRKKCSYLCKCFYLYKCLVSWPQVEEIRKLSPFSSTLKCHHHLQYNWTCTFPKVKYASTAIHEGMM